jgi:hypothetical protein
MNAESEAEAGSEVAAERLAELITSSWISWAIHAGIELGVFDALAEQPHGVNGLAERLGCAPSALRQLLNACEALQLCASDQQGNCQATPMGRLLALHTAGSQQAWARLWCRELAALWTGLAESVRQGASIRTLRGDAGGFAPLAHDANRAEAFHRAMAANTWWVADALARSSALEGRRHVVDVGGGHGIVTIALLRQHRALRGTVYDLAHAAPGAQDALQASGLADRAEFVAGDFFESVPAGGDAYVLKSVLHDWPDADCTRILTSCRAAMSGTARLFVVERLATLPLTPTATDRAWARSDLNMLVAHGACERTQSGFGSLLADAGFAVENVRALSMGLSCIEASPC